VDVQPGGTQPAVLQRGVSRKEELIMTRENGRGLPPWMVWLEILIALHH
jgi:hypothetical protein